VELLGFRGHLRRSRMRQGVHDGSTSTTTEIQSGIQARSGAARPVERGASWRAYGGTRISRHLMIAVAVVFWSAPLFAEIRLLPAFTGLSSPVFVTHAGDGTNRLFIIEQGGAIKVVRPGSTTSTTFLDIRTKVLSGSERGLIISPLAESKTRERG
jgi:hypothetical protein